MKRKSLSRKSLRKSLRSRKKSPFKPKDFIKKKNGKYVRKSPISTITVIKKTAGHTPILPSNISSLFNTMFGGMNQQHQMKHCRSCNCYSHLRNEDY